MNYYEFHEINEEINIRNVKSTTKKPPRIVLILIWKQKMNEIFERLFESILIR